MKRIKGIKTYRYDTGVDIEYEGRPHRLNILVTVRSDLYEATMYCDCIGLAVYMFGAFKTSVTFAEFIDMVEANLPIYIEDFEYELNK